MFLPIRGFPDLGQGRPFGPPDQFQDLCALAFGARRAGLLGVGGLGGLLSSLGLLLRRGLGSALGGFLALARALLLAGTLLRADLLRRDVHALGFAGNASEKWPFLRQICKRRTAGDG